MKQNWYFVLTTSQTSKVIFLLRIKTFVSKPRLCNVDTCPRRRWSNYQNLASHIYLWKTSFGILCARKSIATHWWIFPSDIPSLSCVMLTFSSSLMLFTLKLHRNIITLKLEHLPIGSNTVSRRLLNPMWHGTLRCSSIEVTKVYQLLILYWRPSKYNLLLDVYITLTSSISI